MIPRTQPQRPASPTLAKDAAHTRRAPARAMVVLAVLSLTLTPALLQAQRVPGIGGAELRGGLTFAERADVAANLFAEVDLGYLRTPALRTVVGASRYRANIDREPGGNEGSFRATGVWLGARYDLRPLHTVEPYVRGGLTFQHVSADAFHAEVGELLDGTYIGVAAGVGARYHLDARGQLSLTGEVRRTLINNIGNTAFELGLRLQPRGIRAYLPDPTPLRVAERRPVSPRAEPDAPPAGAGVAEPAAAAPPDTAEERRLAEAERAAREAERAAADARAAELAEAERREREELDRLRASASEAMLRQGLSRAAAAMGTLTSLRETETAFIATISGTAFASGAATLSSAARDEVRVLATVLAGYPGHIVMVEGHTDSVGNPQSNQVLSEDRAAAVRAALIVEGVDPLWTGARGFGAQRPVASNETTAGRAANRRVEIHVSKRPCIAPPVTGPDGALKCP